MTEIELEIAELELIHKNLDEQVAKGYSMYLDDENMSKLKQEKLYIKRKIEKLKESING